MLVVPKPESEWRSGMTKRKLVDQMDEAMSVFPGIEPSFSQPIRDNVLESISQIDGQIVIKVFGDDLDVLSDQAQAVLHAISDVRGVKRAFIDRLGELPQLLIRIDRQAAARYGLNVADIQDVIEMVLGGKPATQLWEGERHFAVTVRLKDAQRTIPNLEAITVATPGGAYVPLSQVAEFKTVGGAMNIAREDGVRVYAIGVFIADRDMGSVVADMKDRVAEQVKLKPGYRVTWSGEF